MSDVFGFGSAMTNEELANRTVRLGGVFHRPSYVRSYAKAARALLDHGVRTRTLDEIGLPLFYLQRHTVELAIKLVIDTMVDIRELDEELAQPTDDAWMKCISGRGERKEALGHSLSGLVATARQLLAEFDPNGTPLPSAIDELVCEIDEFEQRHPDRSRYATRRFDKKKNDTRATTNSLPVDGTVTLELGAIQDRIDDLLGGPLNFDNVDEPRTFYEELALDVEVRSQGLIRMGRY